MAPLEEVAAAVRLLAERNRVIAEGAGACPVACALAGKAGAGKIVCIVSGGNIDLSKLLRHRRGSASRKYAVLLRFSLCPRNALIRPAQISSSAPTSAAWTATANCTGAREEQPAEFWGELAEKELFWFEKWSQVIDWKPPFVKWFVGGKTNVSYNCVDRHLTTHRKNKVAILWEGEPGDQRMISYQELHRLVSRFANVLKSRGLKAGDRAIIYMPMIPELPVALAGLRAARHHSQRGVRRIFRGSAQGAHSGSGSASRHHRRWRLAARQRGQAQARSR